ncbi:ExbD/TolR family protein [Acinetobacter seifertii]|uniref:ExbD/TolR family protein n=1 Tax=Acinetobacter seifertii TaxID=1530123 RepID=UPI001C0CBA56|nr:biopolymer transporter ExbD [Acinetobacter seifertii]MBU3085432.1 biopolymer transporter ExbD [Acinetobacter seifertii]
MAFNSKKDSSLDVVSEINMTPFIDVMLVLLIIFMVAAPMATVNIPLDLPQSNSKATTEQADPVIISLDAKNSIYIGENKISTEKLADTLKQQTKDDKSTRIFIRADKSVAYENFIKLINQLGELGYSKVALVGDQKTGADS